MRGDDGEVVPVWSCKVEGIVNSALADIRGSQALREIIASSGLDIVHHQIEGCGGAGLERLFGLSDDDVGSATELEDGEIGGGKNRA